MANYAYKAVNMVSRKKQEGVIPASSEMEARSKLREMQFSTLSLEEVTGYQDGSGTLVKKRFKFGFKSKVSSKEVMTFSRNLAIMIRGGIPITESLLYFENFSDKITYKAMVQSVRRDILGGMPFSEALGKFPEVFSEIFINITRAGESSGELDVTMERMADLMERTEKIKAKVISTAIYPAIVLGLVGMVLLVIFYFVLPSFEKIYTQMGVDLPLITKIMIFISNCLRNGWFITFPLVGCAVWGFMKFISTNLGKRLIDKYVIYIPILKQVIRFTNVSSFISTLSVCFGAGIPITEGLDYAVSTVGNATYRTTLLSVNTQVQTGRRLGVALAETGIIPELVLLIVATGEESGSLDQSLGTAQEYLEKEIDQRIGVLMSFMEPLLLMFLGIIVGIVALSIYMPLFSMYENM
jgi:type II secretory pathway component PulF